MIFVAIPREGLFCVAVGTKMGTWVIFEVGNSGVGWGMRCAELDGGHLMKLRGAGK